MTNFKGALIVICALCTSLFAQAQQGHNKVWALGTKTGLDFNTSPPSIITTNISSANEGSATVADQNGNLQFYTNGTNVWNASGNIMPNGSNINGTGLNTASTTQAAVIVPFPGNANKYYLFSLTPVSNCRLFVNVVDMTLDNGAGDIDTTFQLRKTVLQGGLTEKMIAAPGCNSSVWLLVHSNSSATFMAYHITVNGINLQPVISQAGNLEGNKYNQGVMKYASETSKIMTCTFSANGSNLGLEVYDFDSSTGIVSAAILLDSINAYGGTFSPNGSKVYAQAITSPGSVYQYDLNLLATGSYKTFLGHSGQYADMKLAPDGKIYVASHIQSPGFNGYRYFARINDPNSSGLSCDFQDTVSSLPFLNAAGTAGALTQGLPNDVVVGRMGYNYPNVRLDTVICNENTFSVNLIPHVAQQNYLWNDNSTDSLLTVSSHGTYWVNYEVGCANYIDTFHVRGESLAIPTIVRSNLQLIATPGYTLYRWYRDGVLLSENTNTLNILGSGTYTLEVFMSGLCFRTAEIEVESTLDIAELDQDIQFTIFPNPAQDFISVNSTNATSVQIFNVQMEEIYNSKTVQLQHDIEIGQLANGVYYVFLKQTNGVSTFRKFVKI